MAALIYQFRLYFYGALIVAFGAFLYFWHYRPIAEVKELKQEVKEKNIVIDLNQFQTKKAVFEEKQKAVKHTLEKTKGNYEKDINLSVGVHTIIFE